MCTPSLFNRVQLFVAHQAPLCMGFSRQEYWSGLPCVSPGGLAGPGIKPKSPVSPALAGRFFTASAAWETWRRMVLAQNQTGTSMEQIESPEIKPHLNGELIYGKWSKSTQWGKDKLFSKWCWENRTTACKIIHSDCSHTPCTKINPQWGGGDKTWNHRVCRRKHKLNVPWHWLSNYLFEFISSGKGNKSKNMQMGLCQTKKLFCSEGNYQQTVKATYLMGEDICIWYIW